MEETLKCVMGWKNMGVAPQNVKVAPQPGEIAPQNAKVARKFEKSHHICPKSHLNLNTGPKVCAITTISAR